MAPMNLVLLACIFLGFLALAYRFYGKKIECHLAPDHSKPTPAHIFNDGTDFIPTKPFYLFAQHFSAIAAAGPIAGPIIACQIFGWLPCLLWIGLGVVFIGAVHDFSSLMASLRHEGASIAEVAKKNLGPKAGIAMMLFIWIAIVYIIIAFADITAASFSSVIEELQGVKIAFNPGGAVAAASCLYLTLACVMGLFQRFLKPPLWLLTILFVPATFVIAWIGTQISEILLLHTKTWILLILTYCGVASLLPMWFLLQPRGYLGGFILYFAFAIGIIGLFFGGYEIKQPIFTTWEAGGPTGSLFPFLFVTIACGACSGFHGLVSSGTTSKQIDRETHSRPVGYGAMLAEGFIAFIALVVIMIASREEIQGLKPGTIYGNGIGKFLTLVIGKENLPFAITFGAMAFSTFVFDTLDVATRLGRYIIQELTGFQNRKGAFLGTLLTTGVPALILWTAPEGSWAKFWTLFGSSNQLLACLTLLIVSVWLKKMKKPIFFTLIPMFFVLIITLWSLVELSMGNTNPVNTVAAISLILLALYLVIPGLYQIFRGKASDGANSKLEQS